MRISTYEVGMSFHDAIARSMLRRASASGSGATGPPFGSGSTLVLRRKASRMQRTSSRSARVTASTSPGIGDAR